MIHFTSESMLYGQPAQLVRDFLRETIGMQIFETEDLRGWLQVSPDTAAAIVKELLNDEYIVHELPRDGTQRFSLTDKGARLAMASMTQPIPRVAAEQLLADLLVRAADSAWQRPFVLQITKVAWFGDMLGDGDIISNVDLAVEVASPHEGKAYTDAQQKRFKLAGRGDERFGGALATFVWPYIKVGHYLRDGSRHVRIRSFSEMYELECPFKVVFETRRATRSRGQ